MTAHQQAAMEVAAIGIAGEVVANMTIIAAVMVEWMADHMAVTEIRGDMAAAADMITTVAVIMAAAVTIRVNIQAVNHIKIIEVTIIKLIQINRNTICACANGLIAPSSSYTLL